MDRELVSECSSEVFERVWRRVMPEVRADCPFALAAEEEERPLPAVVVEQPEEGAEIACLGPASAVHGPRLQQCVDQELAASRRSQALARRVQGSGGKVLAALAARQRRQAKRLSTAYFLISGVQYWPESQGGGSVREPVQAALREQFQARQRSAACYRSSAAGTADPCLEELFHQSAEEAQAQAWAIRTVLEQM
nr:rubrerythrin [uncultured Flavonifractor sp.]